MWELLKNKSAASIWFSRTFSRFGDAFESLALMYLIYELTDSALAMGTIMIFSVVPNIVISPFAGVIGDRYNKKIIMTISEIVRTISILMLPILRVCGVIQLWHIYLIAVVVSVAESFFEPCAQVVMTIVVRKDQLPLYDSAITTSNQIARLLGYSLSGIAISLLDMNFVFVVDAITFACSALAAMYVKLPEIKREEVEEEKGVFKEINGALKYIISTHIIPIIFLIIVLNAIILNPESEFLPIVINDLFNVDKSWSGIFLTVISIGNLLASILFPILFKSKLELKTVVLYGQAIMGIFFVISYLKPNVFCGIGLYIVLGLIASLITMWCSTELQYVCRIDYMARVSSVFSMMMIVSDPLAASVYGMLIDKISINKVFVINGVLFIISAIIVYTLITKCGFKSKYNEEIVSQGNENVS